MEYINLIVAKINYCNPVWQIIIGIGIFLIGTFLVIVGSNKIFNTNKIPASIMVVVGALCGWFGPYIVYSVQSIH